MCAEESFLQDEQPYYRAAGTRLVFGGCPPDCRRDRSARLGRWAKRWKTWRWHSRGDVIGLAKWFASLSVGVQLLLAASLLSLLGLPWRTTIVEIFRSLTGK